MMVNGNNVYSPTQRGLHWLIVLLIVITVPVGVIMVGTFGDVPDAVGSFLYDFHKLIGVTILALVIIRLLVRFTVGAPPPERSLEPWQRVVSELNHWGIYLFLLLVPILGYIALQYYGPINLFNVLPLPQFSQTDQDFSDKIFVWHKIAAF